MRALLLVATLLFGSALLRAQENVPWIRPPAPGVATPRLAIHRAAQRQAWLERVVGKPFAERAQGQRWEAEGKAFVAAAFERWQPRSVYENDAELAQRGWRLRYLLKCEDPLVRCLLGRLEMRASPDGFWHWEGYADSMGLYRTGLISGADRIGRALDDLAKAGTPRGFLASVGLEAARAWMLVNDAGRQGVWKERAEGWLSESLTDGSYAMPGPDEELLIEDVLGPRGASTGAWTGDLRTAVEKAPLSEWARLALLASFARYDADRHRAPGGAFDFSVFWASLAASWKLNPEVPEPAARLFYEGWQQLSIEGASTQEWFDRIVAAQFDYPVPYERAWTWLGPSWMGSVEESMAFGRGCVATKRFDTAVPLFLVHAIKALAINGDWTRIRNQPENGEVLVALGRGLLAEPSRRGDEARWRSLAAVWAWMGGRDREAADWLAELGGEELHPVALQELRFFASTQREMRGEVAIRLTPAREDYEQGKKLYEDHRLSEARDAWTRALAAAEDGAGKSWVREWLALTDFEIEARKGEWLRVPMDPAFWAFRAGKWSISPDGALLLQGEERTAFARFRGRLGLSYEMRGRFDFTVPDGAPRHPELGIAYRSTGGSFVQCFTWTHGERLHAAMRHGIWAPVLDRAESKTASFPVVPPEVAIPLEKVTHFLLRTDAGHVTMELNGERIWDHVENHTLEGGGEYNRIGFVAREPGARNQIAIRDLEIRRLPAPPAPAAE